MKKVLVLCTGNSCRSQIAEGYLQALGGGKVRVWSAGIETHGVNPNAIATMNDDGVDISSHSSNHIDEYRDIDFDYVITVCDHAQENCPYFPSNAIRIHQNFTDPAKMKGSEDEVREAFRSVRDEIKSFAKDFFEAHI